MKRIPIVIGICLVVLFAAAELYVRSDLFANRIRPVVLGPLKEVLGSEAQIGWIRASLLPFSVEARDIVLPDDRGKPIATIRRVRIAMNPFLLLVNKIRVTSVLILEPRIYAERPKQGEWNLVPVIDRVRQNILQMQARGPSRYTLLFKTITVNNGSMFCQDATIPARFSLSGLFATARLNLEGNTGSVTVRNSGIRFAAPAYPELSGTVKAALLYDKGRFRLESFFLDTEDTRISASGIVGSLPERPLDLKLRIQTGPQTIGKLARVLKNLKKEGRGPLEATATVQGTAANPVIEGALIFSGISYQGLLLENARLTLGYRDRHLSVNGENLKISRGGKNIIVDSIRASADYSDNGLDIRRIAITGGDLSLQITGRADPEHGFDSIVTAESRGAGSTLSLLASIPIEGNVRVKGQLSGALNLPAFDGTIAASPVTVRGILFDEAEGRIQFRDNKISLLSVDIHQQKSRYFFNGSVDLGPKEALFAARLKLIRSDVASIVALFYKRLPLQISATGDLSFNGTAHQFTGTGRLSVEAGSAYGESFTRGIVTADLSRDRISFPQVVVHKGNGTVEGSGWIGFNGTYEAALESHGVRVPQVELLKGVPLDGDIDLTVRSSGSFSRPRVDASLDIDELLLYRSAVGSLTSGLHIADDTLTWKTELSEDQGSATLHLGLDRPYAWSFRAGLNGDKLDIVRILTTTELMDRARVFFGGTLSLQGRGSDLSTVSGVAAFDRLGAVVGDYRIANEGTASLAIHGDKITVTAMNLQGQDTKLSVSGSVRPMKELDLSVIGTARLSLLRPLVPEIEYSDGMADIKLTVRDSWKEPDFSGSVVVRNGELKVKDIPQKFSQLAGRATFDESRFILDSLSGQMGGGVLSASGKAQFDGMKLRDFSSRVSFENVSVRYPESLTSTLSGQLAYDGDGSEQSLTGDVAIRRARYDKRIEWKSMLVDIGKGLYQKKKTEAGWIGDTQINIRFSGSENILLQNNLAKIPMDVDVFLRGTVNHPQLLGRIEARKGSVYFRQNEFKIIHGSVDFVDPNRMNPVLDIQAEITIREYLVRMAVSGTADRAVVTFLSDPPLADSDILALLALGKTGSELKGKETGVGMSEAASFATGQFQDVFESRARSLTGLDRFQVDPYISKGDTSVPRVTVGKEIVQDKLYVTYSSNVGATTPEQIFRIEYILNKHFSVVGERNELGNTGADIKYRFEFK